MGLEARESRVKLALGENAATNDDGWVILGQRE